MKLPAAAPASTEFRNAEGSTVPKEFALEARKNPEVISQMAESPSEKRDLEKEALARQYVLIIDRSGSMSWPDGKTTRWESARKAVEKIVESVFKYDIDGSIPLYLFDDQVEFVGECTNSGQIVSVFNDYQPRGRTDLAKCLDVAMKTYLGKNRINFETVPGTTFLVILDGDADDRQAVKDVIRKYADPASGFVENHTNAAISFVQIADDPGATAFLKDLDDGIIGTPDICDFKVDNFLSEKDGVDRLLFDAIFD
ncbi:EsV-1-176 [Ectocarpus siliculosus]|uniref:EsV-1-176 n=1 Tax=Ectocarpus siliculosus TaxID=2880 RepID=D8LPJ6_ECTSI|nr:EsV-1-176 [Ectocarpus siliculosus]|eukprot:CBN80468.1 EsV-1-176 [Ectocarpus siliculosus]